MIEDIFHHRECEMERKARLRKEEAEKDRQVNHVKSHTNTYVSQEDFRIGYYLNGYLLF